MASAMSITIRGKDPVLDFAAQELRRYLGKILPSDISCSFELGVCSEFPQLKSPSVPDPTFDDAIVLQCDESGGIVSGNNPRSVLLAVYRYLSVQGCRWVRPGVSGEFLPTRSRLDSVATTEVASYRHRAVCIEGAVALEHVCDMVDWLPKLGFNGYFIQFREAHTFFNRWYAHEGNPLVSSHRLSPMLAAELTSYVEAEIARRGLLYHKVGHGWTCEPFGIRGLGWERETEPIPETVTPYLAEVNGKRQLWEGIALNTNLCYSNPEVRRIMSTAIAEYAQQHPNIHYLHVWLADGSNNNCECAECCKARPSDFYVRLLNETDEELTRRGLPVKIVFLIYVDLLWPPQHERLANPDRFVLMFAPIARTYSESFQPDVALPALPPFERNRLLFPRDVRSNLAFLKAWQQLFHGDSFDFDYHLMWDHSYDPGHMQISRIIGADMKALRAIGLNGFVSCQIQRVFLPTALPMIMMGRLLWDAKQDHDAIIDDYFRTAFGPDAAKCRQYLENLSEKFNPPYLRGEREQISEEAAQNYADAIELVRAFKPLMDKNRYISEFCWAASWGYLYRHAELVELLAHALRERALNNIHEAYQYWEKTAAHAWRMELDYHAMFDAWLFTGVFGRKFPKP